MISGTQSFVTEIHMIPQHVLHKSGQKHSDLRKTRRVLNPTDIPAYVQNGRPLVDRDLTEQLWSVAISDTGFVDNELNWK